jgi:hypothetical protein
MNEVDKLVVTLQQMLLHIEAELSEQTDTGGSLRCRLRPLIGCKHGGTPF